MVHGAGALCWLPPRREASLSSPARTGVIAFYLSAMMGMRTSYVYTVLLVIMLYLWLYYYCIQPDSSSIVNEHGAIFRSKSSQTSASAYKDPHSTHKRARAVNTPRLYATTC